MRRRTSAGARRKNGFRQECARRGMRPEKNGEFIRQKRQGLFEPAAGIEQAGAKVRFAGLITTPGVAYLTRTRDFVAGVMIWRATL